VRCGLLRLHCRSFGLQALINFTKMAHLNLGELMPFYTIKEAIRCGHRIKLYLAEGEYVVEPHVLGRNRKGKTLLRAYQVRGPVSTIKAQSWKVFDLDRIQHAVESGERFDNPRAGYTPNDPNMTGGIIECVDRQVG
jgi:hypothetical protein